MAEEKKQNQANLVEEENLKDVAGGAIFKTPDCIKGDPDHRWEVLNDQTGEVLARFADKGQAEEYCIKNNISSNRILAMGRVEKMRDAWKQHKKYYGDSDPNWKNPYSVENDLF